MTNLLCTKSKNYQIKFSALLNDIGYSFSEGESYRGSQVQHYFICNKGHKIYMFPTSIVRGKRCRVCDGQCPEQASKRFSALLAEKGWRYQDGERYLSAHKKIGLICDKGHMINVKPHNINNNHGCPTCFLNKSSSPYIKSCVSKAAWRSKNDGKSVLDINEITKNISPDIRIIYHQVKTREGEVVDHIIPFSWFNHSNPIEVKACWSIHNLQIVDRKYNDAKKNRLTPEDIEKIRNSEELQRIFSMASLK